MVSDLVVSEDTTEAFLISCPFVLQHFGAVLAEW